MPNNSYKVSIIIPVYNGEEFITDTIDSCLSQSYNNYEIIVVDDMSKDNSIDLIKNRYLSEEYIYIYSNKSNKGINKTANKAVHLATGDVILFLGQDDKLPPKHIESMIRWFKDDVAFIHCNSKIIDKNSNFIRWSKKDRKQKKKSKTPLKYLKIENFISSTGAIMNKRIFMDLGGFDETYKNYGEWLNWIKLSEKGKVIYCTDTYAYYRKHDNNISKSFKTDVDIELQEYWDSCKKYALDVSGSWLGNKIIWKRS